MGSLREREREVAAVRELLDGRGRMLLLEGRAGIGKTSLIEVACARAAELGGEVLRARGSELESGFAFGVVRQLFERRLAAAGQGERAALLAGPAAAARPLLAGELAAQPAGDSSFAVLHGLYWLVVNLAAGRPVLLAVDDAHWADEASLRWLAYLARRLDGLAAGLLVALRPGDAAVMGAPLLALCAEAAAVLHPALLSERAVSEEVRAAVHAEGGGEASDELCAAVYAACGGNPLYLTELLRAADRAGRWPRSTRLSCSPPGWTESRGGSSPGCAAWVRPRCAWLRRWPCWGTAASCGTRRRSRGCRWPTRRGWPGA